jgi:uncharacterized protein YcbK (DUF882 family)
MEITSHFSLKEFKQPARHGLPELPYPEEWITTRLVPLCNQLELIRSALGDKPITIISGYRSLDYNNAIKGSKKSQHMEGLAADIEVKGINALEVHDLIFKLYQDKKIQIGGLGRYNTFTHVDIRNESKLVTWDGKSVD